MDSPAREAAAAARHADRRTGAGADGRPAISLCSPAAPLAGAAAQRGVAEAEDIALVLHTSGTTSRPKIVPLQPAQRHRLGLPYRPRRLALTPDDVCLNIMPLFHIHGLIAATLSSPRGGRRRVLHAGLQRLPLLRLVRGGPADLVHRRADDAPGACWPAPRATRTIIASGRLRFIRSSSSSLPPQVMAALEETFGVPVIEAYGMTEAAHQMASNPLPPRPRFAGSVGIAAGPEIAIMDEAGTLLPPARSARW